MQQLCEQQHHSALLTVTRMPVCVHGCVQVEVTDVAAGRTWFFEADAWLDASQGDRKTERLLDASSTDPMADRQQYRVSEGPRAAAPP